MPVGEGKFSGDEETAVRLRMARKTKLSKSTKASCVVDLPQVVDKLKSFLATDRKLCPEPSQISTRGRGYTKAIADLIRRDRERYYDMALKNCRKCGYKLCRKSCTIVQDGDFAGIQMKDRNFDSESVPCFLRCPSADMHFTSGDLKGLPKLSEP